VVYARADLVIGVVMWLVELAAAVLLLHVKPAAAPSGASGSTCGVSGVGQGASSAAQHLAGG
jgi:hypothetical protein